jgi:glycosidase
MHVIRFEGFRPIIPAREFHISKASRDKYAVPTSIFTLHGRAVIADYTVALQLAHNINAARGADRFPETAVGAGELYAAGLLDEVYHLLMQHYRERVRPKVLHELYGTLQDALGEAALQKTLRRFAATFPPTPVYDGRQSLEAYLSAATDGTPHRLVVLEELLLLWVANRNPALERFAELFDDRELSAQTVYDALIKGVQGYFESAPPFAQGQGSLFDMLLAPLRVSPHSLSGQLEYVRREWSGVLGAAFGQLLTKVLSGLDILKEEHKPSFVGPGPSVVLDKAALLGTAFARRERLEYERFSPDSSWMPKVVMIAKSTYVWLDQLSRRYRRSIQRLDEIPDEELDELARRGFTGLWLIGLWERSRASQRIKHLRGQPDAVASAYALYDYQIAGDLGGDAAYIALRDRAWQRGIRLASDMVPNHVGIDGRWVIEHPGWFIQLPEPPYPSYSFNGPDLSDDARVGIFLEDHYYDNSDAAVVFKRLDRYTGEARYIYHGNDGTSMPWNDTAQLDYLKPEVREAVIQTILHVARKFPIIRFDAAMTLAKQHIQRLWYPEPGQGGAIPSRAHYGSMTHEEFERAIPNEFWREVVDRVAQEAPDTLLLAEAFWMMEGYFVRTLGMHRVYNSAFMNMLKREENAEYRQLMKNTLEFDPEILKRFVNFMNNPDEETAIAQFGADDKYFGVALLMATMPGLPMFGHGQVEGFHEKYGMEYRRAKWDEAENQGLIARHYREIFPLLHRRAEFAEVENFLLYDFYSYETVNENVFAYSNFHGGKGSLVLYNNKFADASGHILWSCAFKDKQTGKLVQRTLQEGLRLKGTPKHFVSLRDHIAGLEYLLRSDDLCRDGLQVQLGAFKYRVFTDIRELYDADGQLAQLYQTHDLTFTGGVPNLAEAKADLVYAPLYEALDAWLSGAPADLSAAAEQLQAALLTFAELTDSTVPEREPVAAADVEALLGGLPMEEQDTFRGLVPQVMPAVQLWCWLTQLTDVAEGAATELAERLRLARYLELRHGAIGALFDLLLSCTPASATDLFSRVQTDGTFQAYLRVNVYQGVRYFNQERYRLLALAYSLGAALAAETPKETASLLRTLFEAERSSGYQLDKLGVSSEQRRIATDDTPADDANASASTSSKPASPADEQP